METFPLAPSPIQVTAATAAFWVVDIAVIVASFAVAFCALLVVAAAAPPEAAAAEVADVFLAAVAHLAVGKRAVLSSSLLFSPRSRYRREAFQLFLQLLLLSSVVIASLHSFCAPRYHTISRRVGGISPQGASSFSLHLRKLGISPKD